MTHTGHINLLLLDPINSLILFRAWDDEKWENFYGWRRIEDSDVQAIMAGDMNPLFVFPS